MNRKYVMVSLEDARTKKLADVLGSKTCKKIIDLLAEKEASKSEIAKALRIPLSTVEYNVNKLVEAGLVEKSKDYFWSDKGKKIGIYKISNKAIVISPRTSKVKTILATACISGMIGLFRTITQPVYSQRLTGTEQAGEEFMKTLPETLTEISGAVPFYSQPGFWFLVGALFAIVIFILLSWKKW